MGLVDTVSRRTYVLGAVWQPHFVLRFRCCTEYSGNAVRLHC